MAATTKTRQRTTTKPMRVRAKRKPAEATYEDKRKAVRKMDDAALDCQDLRHQWNVLYAWWSDDGYLHRHLECARGCNVTATDHLDAHYDRAKVRTYHYPQAGYSARVGRIDRSMLREESVRRIQVYSTAKAMISATTNGKDEG